MGEFFKFLDSVLNKGGVVATLFFVLVFAFGWAIRVLWTKNQTLHAQVLEHAQIMKSTVESHSRAMQKVHVAHAERLESMAQAHTEEMKAIAEQHTKEKRTMGARLDELQERRVDEARSVTEKVMAYIQHIDTFVAKLEVTIDVLMNAARK